MISENTKGLLAKRYSDTNCPPQIKLGGTRLRFVETHTYLVITLNGKLSLLPHVWKVSAEAKR